MKVCSKCKIEKEDDQFYLKSPDQKWLRPSCKKCQVQLAQKWGKRNSERKKAAQRRCYWKNKEKFSDIARDYYKKNKDRIAKKRREDYKSNREKELRSHAVYREKNRLRIRANGRKYYETFKKNNPEYLVEWAKESKRKRDELADTYIKDRLKADADFVKKYPEIVELKRTIIKIKRIKWKRKPKQSQPI